MAPSAAARASSVGSAEEPLELQPLGHLPRAPPLGAAWSPTQPRAVRPPGPWGEAEMIELQPLGWLHLEAVV